MCMCDAYMCEYVHVCLKQSRIVRHIYHKVFDLQNLFIDEIRMFNVHLQIFDIQVFDLQIKILSVPIPVCDFQKDVL